MVELRIVMNDDGQIGVSGPIGNTLQCYGLIELARDAIREYAADQAKRKVTPPTREDLLNLNGHNGHK